MTTARPKRPTKTQKQKAQAERDRITAERRKDDPFYIHPDDIPDGKAWQWFSLGSRELLDAADDGWGWKSQKKVIVVGESVLLEHSREYVEGKKQQQKAHALKLMEDGEDLKKRSKSPSFIVSREYNSLPANAPPIIAEISIPFAISNAWQNMAAVLDIPPEEYARRRLRMESQILSCSPGYPDYRYAYEAVNITVKPL